jgi:asparagine synthase (glutamine-hydrolysing)
VCGINLVFDRTGHLGQATVAAMNAATVHRGRDNTAVQTVASRSGEWHMGHNRLSVIDTSSAANQPFSSPDGRYHLIYNGEIYNFPELRDELAADGVQFRTHSDTEVVLWLLARRGARGLAQLNGMFALVFIDLEADRALIARDPSGMKPLYWWSDDSRLVVSSELSGVLASGLMPKELDESQVNHFLRFRFARKPHTFFRGVHEMIEGHVTEVAGGRLGLPQSFVLPTTIPDPSGASRGEFLDELERLLVAAIRRHLIADVPVGLLLSGGIDSTLLLALIHDHDLSHLHTFSVVNDASEASFGTEDYHYSSLAASRYGDFPHTEVPAGIGILDGLDDFLANMDQPIGDPASLLTFLVCKEARKSVTVALSGAAADEVFAGYNRQLAFDRYLQYRPMLSPLAPALRRVGAKLPTGSQHRFRKPMLLAQKFTAAVGDDPADTYRRMQGLGGYHDLPTEVRPWAAPAHASASAQFGAALELDLHQYLVSDILMMSDFQSMQSTLEMRVPFLDRELLAWVEAMPPRFLITGGRKWMLGELLRRHRGDEFVDRKKEGFNMPLGNWFFDASQSDRWQFLHDPDAIVFRYVDRSLARGLYNAHISRQVDRTPELFSLLTLHHWLQRHFGDSPAAARPDCASQPGTDSRRPSGRLST